MQVTIGEELMLLSLDDESGVAKEAASAGWAVAGGILADLVLAGRVTVDDGLLAVADRTPTGDPLLDGRLDRLAEWADHKAAGKAVGKAKASEWLTKDRPTAVRDAVQRLCERGLVTEERHRALGIFPVRRYPEADPTVERELRGRLAAAVLRGEDPDTRTATLIALVHATKLHRLAFPDLPRKEVEPRFEAIAAGEWASGPVGEAIRTMQAAIAAITVVTAATAATTAVIT
ncbi:GPP34 family phosphoprotein [Streptomyces sp. SP17BM10]|uniref:GOLPH3/VPS74 family protein n=1 Tax=Streptomyces sp. SP17BM10 TaxID=3002530 RepID=UPI002E765EFE|nr:GPP34 family phosphoprotein [Streptomyces sp. SP17BM10]MEE1788545.1 GPP34 family phosphoprotein [Streptomyces sp. SP17BM10]